MAIHDTAERTVLVPILFAMLDRARGTVRQERTHVRLMHLTIGCLISLGRHTPSQMLVALGLGNRDWSAWYRLFNLARVGVERLQQHLIDELAMVIEASEPALVAVVDGTQLPRTSRRMPGCGYAHQPRSPHWRRGIHLAQRYVGISALLPRSEHGESRAVPLQWSILRTAKTTEMGDAPEQGEGTGGVALMRWLRERWDAIGRQTQPLLVLGDGSYSTAPVLAGLPPRTALLARCAKNRALFALPTYRAQGRGRQRRYGARGSTPQQVLQTRSGWRSVRFMVRGRQVTPRVHLSGPWLVKGAPFTPVMLIVVRGVDRGRGVTRRQRDPHFFLVTVPMTSEDEWDLPLPLADLLAWAWQRWEVEVMHRELKSGFGLGQQQAFSPRGAATVIPWMLWVYALLILTGYHGWRLGPGDAPAIGRWWQPRRWSIGQLLQAIRQELWHAGEFQPVWSRSPDTWHEITTWMTTQTNAALGVRRI
jgi:hypothetical protein